jgi:UDP-glucose 4-epimerase
MLQARAAHGVRHVSLRYFNAAGADPEGDLGEDHEPETHLVPLALLAALGRKPPLTIFGDDYATPDGTCLRDYVHVSDLADAHVAALRHLLDGGASMAFNLGAGIAHSVREVIGSAEKAIGRKVPRVIGPRRAGDPARLMADIGAARRTLGWTPRYPDLHSQISHAWNWLTRGR